MTTGCFLDWIGVTVETIVELLWYLDIHPRPTQGVSAHNLITVRPPAHIPPSVPVETPPSAIFALVIGIDRYKHDSIGNLQGSVADADDVVNFLTDILRVPHERIQNLRNEEATREQIIGHIRGLATNRKIKDGDPILIYYAGHGGEAKPPAGWTSGGGKIQMILPHDFIPHTNTDESSQGILDVTLSALLTRLAGVKGDNITVIFDCCHSGSGTRTDEHIPLLFVRGVVLPDNYDILPTVDQQILSDKDRAACVAKGFEKAGMASHTLLAACEAKQKAHESNRRGDFTSALLTLLRKDRVDRLTYEDVIMRLPDLPSQHPQCEGVNMGRILFNAKAPTPGRVLYEVNPREGHAGEFVLSAGEAHGVTDDAVFDVYEDKSLTSPLLATLIASESQAITTVMKPDPPSNVFTLSKPAWALQTRVGRGEDIRISLPLDSRFLDVFTRVKDEMKKKRANKRGIRLVKETEQPDLTVVLAQDATHVVFVVMEEKCVELGLTVMPFRVRLGQANIYPILASAADFYWHLHRRSKRNGVLASKVSFECTKLKASGQFNEITREPPMIPDGENLNIADVIKVVADDTTDYGFKITNNFHCPLFVSLFYFDVSDLSITPYYQPTGVAKTNPDPTIPAHESLTIGYGTGGARPLNFFLRAEQKVDVGFLKLFISTEHVDLGHIAQDSPFEDGRANAIREKPRVSVWDTMLVAMVHQSD
ncbi:hypothetical protein OF83DRAFT_1176058 [Amylostereum chailletii]|nr:hypothetical protein OF83DRAFT_1176058 [Amylostereum chailletii]